MSKTARRRRAGSKKSKLPYRVSERRLFFLQQLGYNSYSHYLNSSLWKEIRSRVLDRCGGMCERKGCRLRATQVHHLSYGPPTLRGDRLDKLAALCGNCHRFIEFNQWGDKIPLDKANKKLKKVKRYRRRRRLKVDLWRNPKRWFGEAHLRAITREAIPENPR